jgi:hypothetical protein
MSWVAAGMTAAGAIMAAKKNERARQVEDADRKLASATAKYSPWTGMTPNQIRNAGSTFGDIAGGAMSGLTGGMMMKQGMATDSATPVASSASAYQPSASAAMDSSYQQQIQQSQSPWENLMQQQQNPNKRPLTVIG